MVSMDSAVSEELAATMRSAHSSSSVSSSGSVNDMSNWSGTRNPSLCPRSTRAEVVGKDPVRPRDDPSPVRSDFYFTSTIPH